MPKRKSFLSKSLKLLSQRTSAKVWFAGYYDEAERHENIQKKRSKKERGNQKNKKSPFMTLRCVTGSLFHDGR